MGNTPSVGQYSGLALKPTVPVNAAGWRTEPPVSEPKEKAHRPAAMPTAEPWLDPPVMRLVLGSQGFHGKGWDKLNPPIANSVVRVLPKITQPARRKAEMTEPSSRGTKSCTFIREIS